MVTFHINNHTFTIHWRQWDRIQPAIRNLLNKGTCEFGFVDALGDYHDVRITNGVVILASYGPAPTHMKKE